MKSGQLRLRQIRPRSQLRTVIDHATTLRKLLKPIWAKSKGGESSGKVRDALRTVQLMQHLARLGIRSDAADAIVIAEYLDITSQVLAEQIDEILASHKHVRK